MNQNVKLLVLFFLLLKCFGSEGAKILGVFPTAGKSVNIIYQKLIKGLAEVGHDVTVISAYNITYTGQNGSINTIVLTELEEDFEKSMEYSDLYSWQNTYSFFESTTLLQGFVVKPLNKVFQSIQVQELFKSNKKFDALVLGDGWIDSVKVFARRFNCPIISLVTFGNAFPRVHSAVGAPLSPSYVPHFFFTASSSNRLSFMERLENFLFFIAEEIGQYMHENPIHEALVRMNFKNISFVNILYEKIDLVLLCSHSSFRQAFPLAPNMIEVGGLHIEPPKELPNDLKRFLDEAEHGVIYFSMGSFLRGKQLPADKRKMFLNVFKKLKQKVLWKFEDVLPGQPDNVMVRKWFPQNDVLAHPNVKLFITHGGHGSITEAIHNGVPCLVIPLYFDQFQNAKQIQTSGFGLQLPFQSKSFTQDSLMSSIQELLNNSRFKQNAKRKQQLFLDRPMKPLDTATYWIGYVIRHKGAHHLKLDSLELPWYIFYCVDVIVFLLAVIVSVLLSTYYICYILVKIYYYSKDAIKEKTS